MQTIQDIAADAVDAREERRLPQLAFFKRPVILYRISVDNTTGKGKAMDDTIILDGNQFEGYAIPSGNTFILVIKAKNGFLGCGYISLETAEKVGDAVAIVSGVKSFDDMLNAQVKSVSSAAAKLGVVPGMSGRDALLKMK
jgi:uncharacterized protein YunC (DUF1805 family)